MEGSPPNAGELPRPSDRLGRGWRATATVLLLGSAATAIGYRLLVLGHLEQTSALFVGLPLLLGLLTAHLTHARSPYGRVLRADILFLAVVAPLLGEGSVCLLMAAPIWIGVTIFGVAIYDAVKHRAVLGVALLPLAAGLAEHRAAGTHPVPMDVTTRTAVAGTASAWVDVVSKGVTPAPNHSRFLALGFPLPLAYRWNGDDGTIAFSRSEGVSGSWQVHRDLIVDGVRFTVIRDTTKVAHWMSVQTSEIRVESSGAEVVIVQTTRFVPLLSPGWYFDPAERFAIREAHRLAIESWRGALAR
jgi:hypothetical protein